MSSNRRTRKSNRSSRKSKYSNWKQEWFLISLPYLCFGFLLFVVFDFVMDSFFGETYPSRQEDAYFGPALGIDYQEHFQSYGKPGWMLDESSPASSSRDWDSKYFSQHRLDQYDYDAIYSSNGKHLSYNIEDSQIQISNTYTSSDILERGCDLTVVLMDPRIPSMSFQDSVWYTLESVAAYAPYACVLLQTASCSVENELIKQGESVTQEQISMEISNRIYKHSLPLFRQMMLRGQVRYTILNHTKYQLTACDNFLNPSKALMNVNYWGSDEFIPKVDSDQILIIQSDAVLCHNFLAKKWTDLAFVGAPWPPTVDHRYNPEPPEGLCEGMPMRYRIWFLDSIRFQKLKKRVLKQNGKPDPAKQEEIHLLRGRQQDKNVEEEELQVLDTSRIPSVCSNGRAPIGNGGFSLRSRQWMRHAIQTCPQVHYSGVEFYRDTFDNPLFPKPVHDNENESNTVMSPVAPSKTPKYVCKVQGDINEDVYFGTVLAAIGAPLPSAYEASLLALEMLWPEQVASTDFYGPYKKEDLERYANFRMDPARPTTGGEY